MRFLSLSPLLTFMMAPISTEELYQFHKTHREVFCFLVFKLHRDLAKSLLVMALWIWLEYNGYPQITHEVMDVPYTFVNGLVDEAVSCLECLEEEKSRPRHFCNVSMIDFVIVLHRSLFFDRLVSIFEALNSFYEPLWVHPCFTCLHLHSYTIGDHC